jgi:hypothetical protein
VEEGEHAVSLRILNLPDSLQHYAGNSKWHVVDAAGKRKYPVDERPRLEVFVIHDKPADFYKEDGVWVEAMRLMFKRAGVTGLKRPESISAKVTTYCHSGHGMIYETVTGGAQFGVKSKGGEFELLEYIERKSSNVLKNQEKLRKKIEIQVGRDHATKSDEEKRRIMEERFEKEKMPPNTVNCYDQAAAVQAFCGCLGVDVTWIFQYLFGYIKTTDLVGVGMCNNPFYKSNGTRPIVPDDDPDRTGFGNHAFIESKNAGAHIRDACAGPHIREENLRAYFVNSVDAEETAKRLGKQFGRPNAKSWMLSMPGDADRTGSVKTIK